MARIDLWTLDYVQFPRLLAEIAATQDTIDMVTLCESMDLEECEINELFDRAQQRHAKNVANLIP